MGGLGGDDLDDIAVLQAVVKLHQPAVHLRADHVVADGRVDVVGKVDGRRAAGEVNDVALRREHKHLVGEHVHLQRVDEILGVRALLIFEQAAHPLVVLLIARALSVLLVLPMCRDAVFGDLVHLLRADLYLEGDAALADDGGVQALVHVGLGRTDIVLEAAEHRLIQVVDHAEDIVAVGDGVDDHAEGKQVKHVVKGLVLRVHLAVDGVGVLHAAVDIAIDPDLLEPGGDLVVDGRHEAVVLRGLLVERLDDLLIADRVEVLQRQILQLPLHLLHAEPVGDGGVDLHRFKRLLLLLLRGLVLHRAHVVQAVGDLDEDDADVLAHGEEHLAQVFHLLLGLGGIVHARQLADALDEVGDGGGEQLGDLLMRGRGVLDGVVQQRRGDGLRVQMQLLGHDLRHGERMGDKRRVVLAELALVGLVGEFKSRPDQVKVRAGVVPAHRFNQMVKALLYGHCVSPPEWVAWSVRCSVCR